MMDIESWADAMATAHLAGKPKPNISQHLSLDDAYRVQAQMIYKSGLKVVGYKSALTNKQAQAAFNISEPVIGALLSNEDLLLPLALEKFSMPMVETELGFRLSRSIKTTITRDKLTDFLEPPQMMIEIAQVGYAEKLSLVDLVAGNSASGTYLEGETLKANRFNDVLVTLKRDGDILHSARTDDIGDQHEVALWLINKAVSLGYQVEQGMILMTGSLGKIQPALPGHYVATYEGADSSQVMQFELVRRSR